MTNRKNLAELGFTQIEHTATLVGGAATKEKGRMEAKKKTIRETKLTSKLEAGIGNEDKIKERLVKLQDEIGADPIDEEGPIGTK